MRDHTMTTGTSEGLVCHWVAVTDETGRTHLEARWGSPRMTVRAPHAA
jgi:hypothetical protein